MCDRKPEVLGVYDAERIVAKKINSGKPLFMIKWQGYCSSMAWFGISGYVEPAIWSRDTGQQIPCFDRCQLIII